MTRKLALDNETVIERLCDAGFWDGKKWTHDPDYRIKGPFSTIFSKGPDWSNHTSWRFVPSVWNYMIPVEIYKKHVQGRYRVMLHRGTQVRKRTSSTRSYERSTWNNVLCDTKSWDHLGIGSGHEYKSDRVKEILKKYNDLSTNNYRWNHATLDSFNMEVLIGNKRYPANLMQALQMAIRLREQGKTRRNPRNWSRSLTQYEYEDFIDEVSIGGDGFFGPKRLINGVVTNVFVHFLYPKWERKRESRFEVLFETGAKGIFTSDYLDVVYDTDYEPDQSLYVCPAVNLNKIQCRECKHRNHHIGESACKTSCVWSGTTCRNVYDFNTLIDTTCGKALDYVDTESATK